MRLLIIHHEAQYFGGAEVLLGDFLVSVRDAGVDVTLAAAGSSRVASSAPAGVRVVHIPGSDSLSPRRLVSQLRALSQAWSSRKPDVVHGWAARDWELTAFAGLLTGRPKIGTLHDHPGALYLSRARQLLMRLVGNHGLDRLVCPSEAVRNACRLSGYVSDKLAVVHNGVRIPAEARRDRVGLPVRLGFLGTLSEGKGLAGLLEMLDRLDALHPGSWELEVGGAVQDSAGQRLVDALREKYGARTWWPRVQWRGWVDDREGFMRQIDLLIFPSAEFEAFGLVVGEAAGAGIPVLAASVGAVVEIVEHGETGWLFQPRNWAEGAHLLANLVSNPDALLSAGRKARTRIEQHFTMDGMVTGYCELYSSAVR